MTEGGEQGPSRLPPHPREAWGEAEREVCGFLPGRRYWEVSADSQLMQLLVRHPPLAMAYLGLGRELLQRSRLPDRTRELLTLRVAAITDAAFEWVNHVDMARAAGITDAEIAAVREGSAAPNWNASDRAILAAVEQLFATARIDEATWAVLAASHDVPELMELIFCIGHYAMTSWAINAFGVGVDDAQREMMALYLRNRAMGRGEGEPGSAVKGDGGRA